MILNKENCLNSFEQGAGLSTGLILYCVMAHLRACDFRTCRPAGLLFHNSSTRLPRRGPAGLRTRSCRNTPPLITALPKATAQCRLWRDAPAMRHCNPRGGFAFSDPAPACAPPKAARPRTCIAAHPIPFAHGLKHPLPSSCTPCAACAHKCGIQVARTANICAIANPVWGKCS